MLRKLLFLMGAIVVFAAPVSAQDLAPAYLVADQITLDGESRLIAEGNVEIIHEQTRLRATRVVFDGATDVLTIEGPLRLNDGKGLLVLADSAELDSAFENGLLQGARMLLDNQLQLAAADARRVDGKTTQLRRVVATSCQVCGDGQPPVWQIRARRVTHDEVGQQLYFEDAQLRMFDVPVVVLPRLRLPDPTLRRARGFLIPELESSTLLGFGIKVPYFLPIGEHADLTVTPHLSPVTRTLNARVRRAYARGDVELNAALSRDSLETGLRGYLFAEGAFDLASDAQLRFDIETATDERYLSDYSYTDADRLDSAIQIDKVQGNRYSSAQFTHFQSLRETESNATQPTLVLGVEQEHSLVLPRMGGVLRMQAASRGHFRTSDLDEDGRDVWRLHAEARYLNSRTLPFGLRLGTEAGLFADLIATEQDSTVEDRLSQVTPAAALTLRWPLAHRGDGKALHLLEPVAQLGWTGGSRLDFDSDESEIQEFDEGNLLALSRFPASDRLARGAQGATGLRWRRHDPLGWSSSVTLGRVWHDQQDPAFSTASGLSGAFSDWLVATQLRNASGVSLAARGLFGNAARANSAEARAAWAGERFGLDATYVLEIADAAENRPESQSEWNIAGHYDVSRNWTASSNWRYDLAADNFARAGLRLDYRNECVDVGFSVSRRFASSANVEPSTSLGLTVTLKGFSTGGAATPEIRSCQP